ncbi:MAG: FAD:protein FMN transferase [Ruminococcus sp.]|nr:FAD:protein FMN transferase [Ruminococcus sp.]
MSKAYRSQNIFFALGVLCTLTVYDGNRFYALSRAKERVKDIDRKSGSAAPVAIGYAAQEIKRIFKQEGVTEAVIQLGDTVVNMGRTRRIGIQNPFSKSKVNFAFLDVGEKAIVTLNQKELSESADCRHHLASVTLIGKDAVQLSKLCYTVSGYSLNEALAFLKGTEFEAIIVTKDEQVFTTCGLSRERQIAA